MPVIKQNQFPDYAKLGKSIDDMVKSLPVLVKNRAVNFFKDSFDRKGFINDRFEPWTDRVDRDANGSLMLQTGNLKNSIFGEASGNFAILSSDTPYSAIHNEGGTVSGTANVRSHTRRRNGKTHQVKSHTRNVNTTIPQRQFMGHSNFLMKDIERNFHHQLERIIERDLNE